MPVTIGSNIASLRAQRQLSISSNGLGDIFTRLSSGQRINSAGDDAAGLSISSNLDANHRVNGQAIRNLNDGISALNIAEGAVSSLQNIVVRQRELAEQAANGTYSNVQRIAMDKEANALVNEYNRIIQVTTFNNRRLTDGSFSNVKIQGGVGVSGGIAVDVGALLSHGVGDGTFYAQVSYSFSEPGGSVALADVNNDGKLDFIEGTYNILSISLGNGNGTFLAAQTFNAGYGAGDGLFVEDVNSDGKLDIVAGGNSVKVFYGDGTGSFALHQVVNAGGANYSPLYVDLDGDGIKDILTGNYVGMTALRGNGDGTFRAGVSISSGSGSYIFSKLQAGDFNGDGLIDIIATENGAALHAFINTRNFRFSDTQLTSSISSGNQSLIADIDRDGNSDIVYGGNGILYGNGNGTFRAAITFDSSSIDNSHTALYSDLNGDGYKDIIFSPYNGDIRCYLANGDGTFQAPRTMPMGAITGSNTGGVALGDLNGDGVLDLVRSGSVAAFGVYLANSNSVTTAAHLNLTSKADARDAISSLAVLQTSISAELGRIGANQSRLAVAANTVAITRESEAEANSRIRDADIASESADLVHGAILQQAATAVLAQANQQPQLSLRLLSGLTGY